MSIFSKPYDVLAIGDVVTDLFINLKDAELSGDLLCVRYGDKVAFESTQEVRAVGNAANAAVSTSRLGLRTGFLAHVGKDQHGKDILEALKEQGIDTAYVQSHKGIPTNYHYVLWFGVDRTILIKHAEFPYALPKGLKAPRFIYLSSLGENSLPFHGEIARFLAEHPETKLAFQPGTFQMKLGTEALKDIYANTYAFFCNTDEARRILKSEERDVKALMRDIHALGPKLVFVTDGIDGAYASDGTSQYFMPIYPEDAFERTGAGDAFSSTVTAALALGKPLEEALAWGPVNSAAVVQKVGAQQGLLSREELEGRLSTAPESYKPSAI